jgi:hypothetical protein
VKRFTRGFTETHYAAAALSDFQSFKNDSVGRPRWKEKGDHGFTALE